LNKKSPYERVIYLLVPISIIVVLAISSVEYSIWLSQSDSTKILYIIKAIFLAILALEFLHYARIYISDGNWRQILTKGSISSLFIILVSEFGFTVISVVKAYLIKWFNFNNVNYFTTAEVIGYMIVYNSILIILSIRKLSDYKCWIIRNKAILTFVIYIFIWFWFGCFFFYQAQRGNDSYFSFNNNKSNVDVVVKELIDEGKIQKNERQDINKIIENNEGNIEYKKLKVDNKEVLFTVDEIGEDWGMFYDSRLSLNGYTHYDLNINGEKIKLSEDLVFSYRDTKKWSDFVGKEFIKVDLYLYKLDKDSEGTVFHIRNSKKYQQNIGVKEKPSKVYTLLLDEKGLENFLNILKNNEYANLYNLLSASHTLLDTTCCYTYDASKRLVYRPLSDFLYFSAITITTVGYGDISPNNNLARNAVMIEVLLGVIVIGVFVTFITNDRKKNLTR